MKKSREYNFAKDLHHRQKVDGLLEKLTPITIFPDLIYKVGGKTYFKVVAVTKDNTTVILRDLPIDLSKIRREDLEIILHKCGADYKVMKDLYKPDLIYLAERMVAMIRGSKSDDEFDD